VTEHTARSFSSEYKVSEKAARRYLNALVENGRARAVKKPLPTRFKGKEVVTRMTVTTYRDKGTHNLSPVSLDYPNRSFTWILKHLPAH